MRLYQFPAIDMFDVRRIRFRRIFYPVVQRKTTNYPGWIRGRYQWDTLVDDVFRTPPFRDLRVWHLSVTPSKRTAVSTSPRAYARA
jgi:hypothetical protein